MLSLGQGNDEDLLQEVAARIIQHYFRQWRGRPTKACPPKAAASSPVLPAGGRCAAVQQGHPSTCRVLDSRATERLRQCRAGRGRAKPPLPPRPGSCASGPGASSRPGTSSRGSSTPRSLTGTAAEGPSAAHSKAVCPPLRSDQQQVLATGAQPLSPATAATKMLRPEDSAEHVSSARRSKAAGAAARPAEPKQHHQAVAAAPLVSSGPQCDSHAGRPKSSLCTADATSDCSGGGGGGSNTGGDCGAQPIAAAVTPVAGAAGANPLRASAATEKMSHILSFLDELEAQANKEAATVLPGGHPLARALTARPVSLASQRLAAAAAAGDPDISQGLAAAGASWLAASAAEVLGDIRSSGSGDSHSVLSQHACRGVMPASQLPLIAEQLGMPLEAAAAATINSSGGGSNHLAGTECSVLDAAAVAGSVKAKIQRLQAQVAQREAQVTQLAEQVQQAQQAHEAALQAQQAKHQAQLAAQKEEHEATLARNLQFMDRILADKDALAAKCGQLGQEATQAQAECARQMEALKEGLAKELRKQKEGWLVAERAKREAWMAEQARSIRESTIRGLEPEVARLVEAHQAELRRAEHRHEAECSRRLAATAAQHEQHIVQLRQQWGADKAAAVEAERAAAREQLKDAQQRFEAELQGLRVRLAAKHEEALDSVNATRLEDRARAEERLQALAREHEQRLAAARSEAAEDRAAAARQHQREMEALKDKYETGQEAWRAAVAERAKQEVEAREAALRRQLAAERDAELRAVIGRLEAEFLAKEEALQEELSKKEAAAEAHWADEVSRLRSAESAAREALAAAEARLSTGESRTARLEELLHTLQREVVSKAASTQWLEEQLGAAKREVAAREERLKEAVAERDAAAAADIAVLEEQLNEARGQLVAAQQEAASIKARQAEELGALEERVRCALSKKDEAIAALREQLAAINQQLAAAGEDE